MVKNIGSIGNRVNEKLIQKVDGDPYDKACEVEILMDKKELVAFKTHAKKTGSRKGLRKPAPTAVIGDIDKPAHDQNPETTVKAFIGDIDKPV